jgi:hypothetical protein
MVEKANQVQLGNYHTAILHMASRVREDGIGAGDLASRLVDGVEVVWICYCTIDLL